MAEMITENEAKLKVETIKPLQESGAFCVCPRCGGAMKKNAVENSLSWYADVWICSDCGVDEAMRHHAKEKQLPFTEWDVVKRNDKILERN